MPDQKQPAPSAGQITHIPSTLRGLPLDHVAVAAYDLDAHVAPYRLLGLEVISEESLAQQGVRMVMLAAGESRIELLEPLDDESPIARFLAKRGPGLHHLAFRVEDLDEQVARLKECGARFTSDAPSSGHEGSRVIFLHPSWTGGVLLELVERV